jgi:tetratricopeptide (TPR) repeat protein
MDFLNFGGATARSDGRGAVSTFRHGPAVVDRPVPPQLDIPTISPTPPPRPPRPSLDQIVAEIFTQVWARFRLVLAQRGLSSKKLLWMAGATALLMIGAHWAYPSVAFTSHRTAAQSDENRGDEQDAIGEYTQMIALQPRNPEGYIHRALAYYTAFQYGQAIADETQVQRLTTNPQQRAKSLMWRGYDYDLSGDHARGITDFTASLAISPRVPDTYAQTADASDKTPDAHKGRLWAYWRSKQYLLSARDCDALIAADGRYAGSYLIRGRLRCSMGNTGGARTDFEAAYRRAPHLLPAYLNLENMLEKQGQPRQALDVAQAALRANPSSAVALGNVGWFLYAVGSVPEAIAEDQQALSLDGSQDWVRYNLGLAFAVRGDWPQAQAAYLVAVRQATHVEWSGAVEEVRQALARQPQSQALQRVDALLRSHPITVMPRVCSDP